MNARSLSDRPFFSLLSNARNKKYITITLNALQTTTLTAATGILRNYYRTRMCLSRRSIVVLRILFFSVYRKRSSTVFAVLKCHTFYDSTDVRYAMYVYHTGHGKFGTLTANAIVIFAYEHGSISSADASKKLRNSYKTNSVRPPCTTRRFKIYFYSTIRPRPHRSSTAFMLSFVGV